jgi:rod shape-determining protein MreC
MESVLGRYRNLIVLVGVLFAQVLGLAVQVKRTNDSEPTRLIRVWVVSTIVPLEKALSWIQLSTGDVWHNYFYLRGVRAENRALRAQLQQLNIEQARLSQDADQARRLQALLGFKERFISQTMAAQVIGGSGSEFSRSVSIDKGERDHLKADMAVITADGIVGKILRVYHSTSQVLLINDQTSGVGAILDKTRLQGILRGTAAGETSLEKVMSDETVPAGETVLTSGGDGVFPKGLVIGRVTKVSTGNDLFLNIRVRPAADLSKLEEVLVVTKVDERQTETEPAGTARAVDILAQRLPTVPPKANTTEKDGAPGTATPAKPALTKPAVTVTKSVDSTAGVSANNGANSNNDMTSAAPRKAPPAAPAPSSTSAVNTGNAAVTKSGSSSSASSNAAPVKTQVAPSTPKPAAQPPQSPQPTNSQDSPN